MYLYLTSFLNLRIFLTENHLKRSETQIVNSLTVLRLHAFLIYVDLPCISSTCFLSHICVALFLCGPSVSRGYLGLKPSLMINWLTVPRMRNSNMIKNFKTIILFILTDKTMTRDKFSRIYKSETIITKILYCLALV